MMSGTTTRRSFLKQAALAGAAMAAGPAVLRGGTIEKLRVAFIGTGGMGGGQANELMNLGAVCPCYADVDKNQWGNVAKRFPEARGYQDYREMLEKHAKDIDAVMVGTPDHHHYPATMLAMKLGKAVYTQKPLTHTVWESRQLTLAAQKYKVATQMGNQGHAGEGWRLVYEWIHSGALGEIREVHNWTNRPIWPQGEKTPEGEDKVPANLNWDVWVGPAPMRPYKEGKYHTFAWRGWWDFGAGALGDMACHTMDGMFWALDPGHPTAVEPIAFTEMGDSFPKASAIRWEFPAKNGRPAFAGYWYDGGLKPAIPKDLEYGRQLPFTGNLFIGTKASIMIGGDYGDSPRIIPEAKMKQIGRPAKTLERSVGHYKEWFMAAKGEKPADFCKSNFGYAGPFTEMILLGNVALKMGRRLEWDGPNLKVTNVPEANRYINKEYRQGWLVTL